MEPLLADTVSHDSYVRAAYAFSAALLVWMMARTWLRHRLASRALTALERPSTLDDHES